MAQLEAKPEIKKPRMWRCVHHRRQYFFLPFLLPSFSLFFSFFLLPLYLFSSFIFLCITCFLSAGCHVSCRACVGPESSDCVRCVKPEKVLQPQNAHVSYGMCLSSCLSQHYLDSDVICRGKYTKLRSFFFVWFLQGFGIIGSIVKDVKVLSP